MAEKFTPAEARALACRQDDLTRHARSKAGMAIAAEYHDRVARCLRDMADQLDGVTHDVIPISGVR
jgi:hypothetical protein